MAKKPTAAKPKRKPKSKLHHGAPKGHFGVLPHVVTPERRLAVQCMAACGNPHWLIAQVLGFSQDTLERHYADELANGKPRAIAMVGGLVVKQAMEGDRPSQFFYLKTQGGWRTTDRLEHTGPEGAPIPIAVGPQYDLSHLSKAELRAFEALALKALPAPPEADQI